MTVWFVAPAFVAVVAAVMAAVVSPRHWPRAVSTLLAALDALAAVSFVLASLFTTFVYAVDHSPLDAVLAWCPLVSEHHVPHWMGLAASVVAAFSAGNMLRWCARRRKRLQLMASFEQPFVVTRSDRPCAYAVPGNPGTIVVSAGMLRRLDADGRRVLLAHEEAHLRHRHDRFLDIAGLASAALPVLHPVHRRLRLAVESWADDDAVKAVGDRRMVARAIAKAGLIRHDFADGSALAMADTDVTTRVQRLLAAESRCTDFVTAGLVASLPVLAVVASSGLQMHHLASFVEHVCHL